MNRTRLIHAVTAICFGLGCWQLGEGVWLETKAWLAQQLLIQAWSETLDGAKQVRPWPWADTWPVARLQLKRLGVDQIVLSDASGRSMAFGPGHVVGTNRPGQGGNVAISGHRDTHFNFLKNVRSGDRVELITRDGKQHGYQVMNAAVHHKDETWVLQDSDDERITLITCYPFDAIIPGGPMRYVVQAKAVVF